MKLHLDFQANKRIIPLLTIKVQTPQNDQTHLKSCWQQPAKYLSVSDHFLRLELKRLKFLSFSSETLALLDFCSRGFLIQVIKHFGTVEIEVKTE